MLEVAMELKKITAIIRASKLEDVERRLQESGVDGVSVSTVKGYGEYKNFLTQNWMVTHSRIEIFTIETEVKKIVDIILDTASCGLAGDGVIAVLPVEKFFKIRDKAEKIL